MALRDYIGIPYKDHGYGFDGADCWQLVRLFYRYEMGVELPDIHEYDAANPTSDLVRHLESLDQLGWELTNVARFGDVVLFDMLRRGCPDHMGIYVGDGRVLHTSAASMSVIQRLPERLVWGVATRVTH